MNADEPLAFFITWTVYGSHLQGDERGWRWRRHGVQSPQPQLVEWRRQRLKHDVLMLSPMHREVVEDECRQHCEFRGWHLWAVEARSNHVHVVVTAAGFWRYRSQPIEGELHARSARTLAGIRRSPRLDRRRRLEVHQFGGRVGRGLLLRPRSAGSYGI